MTKRFRRVLDVNYGTVQCTENKRETLEKCRFCVHSTEFLAGNVWVASPARAYCMIQRATNEIDLLHVKKVCCDDKTGEGFRSIMNIIS